LIELGFLKFYNKRLKEVKNRRSLILPIYNKSGKTVPLFELTKPPSKDFCDAVADWFNEHILEKQLGIKSPEISIYCLRHTFKDAMSRFNPSEIISELVGHKAGITTTETVYGTERALVLKKEAIEKLWFETFDFNSFKK
jgi:integrase